MQKDSHLKSGRLLWRNADRKWTIRVINTGKTRRLNKEGEEGPYLKCVSVFETVRNDLSFWHMIEPVEFASAVLLTVERREAVETSLQLQQKRRRVYTRTCYDTK